MSIGAEPQEDGSRFRVWAPKRKHVEVVAISSDKALWELPVLRGVPLERENNGYFSGTVQGAGAGYLYAYALDGDGMYPDPASRFQPFGPHGASQVTDPAAYKWKHSFQGCSLKGQVLYELHVGTFTEEGTYSSAAKKLKHLKDVGVTVVELMPLSDFPGRFGWGYDGVNLFAPTRLYGTPDDLRAFIDAAHAVGLGVILDVVYNHIGPSGNYMGQFSDDYLTDKKHKTDWGAPINFDGDNNGPVRDYFVANAAYWIREFHFDGLRLDATQAIFDDSRPHILRQVRDAVTAAANGREVFVVAENEDQDAQLMTGFGIDGVWNDDFHHSAIVATIGNKQAYYQDYFGRSQEFISAAKYGYLFQGQQYRWQRKRRGRSVLGIAPERFVNYIENHDQVSNSAFGQRLASLACPAKLRAMTALALLSPGTPMLFQGQEWGTETPFQFFADHDSELAKLVREGRHKFLSQFPNVSTAQVQSRLPDPENVETFERCKLDWNELSTSRAQSWLRLHRDLLQLRRDDPAFNTQEYGKVDGAVLTEHAFLLRYFLPDKKDRLLIINFGPDLTLYQVPEPLLAPPELCKWDLRWHSEAPEYGGSGYAHPDTETDENWVLRGEAAAVLVATDGERDMYRRRLWRLCPEMNENDEIARQQMDEEGKA